MPIPKICQHCGVGFSVSPRRHELVKFCSKKCKYDSGWNTFKCACCNVEFKRKKSDHSDSARRYCSVACDRKSRLGRKQLEKPEAEKHFKECETCGKQFSVVKSRKDSARFCSVLCKSNNRKYAKECSERQIGEKSWRWSGGMYQTHQGYKIKRVNGERPLEHRHIMLQAILQESPNHPFIVYENGNAFLSKQIEVHHIDRNRSNNEISNLLAVTKDAHAQIHHRNKKPEAWECWPPNPKVW